MTTTATMTIATVIVCSSLATAQPQPAAPAQANAAAEVLFDKGIELKKAAAWKEACRAFEDSQKLDPQFGTLYNIAECDTHIGKLASAWLDYRELSQRDTNVARREHSGDLARELEPRLPKLLVKITPSISGTVVTMNGAVVTNLIGIATPVDLGTYEIAAVAPSTPRMKVRVEVKEEGKTVVATIDLDSSGFEPQPTGPTTQPAPQPVQPPSVAEPWRAPSDPNAARRIAGISMTAGGGALIVGGVVVGALARSKWNDATKLCPDQACESPGDITTAKNLADAASTRGTISDVLLAAGVVAAGAGVYLLVTSHHDDATTALRIVPSAGGIVFAGGF